MDLFRAFVDSPAAKIEGEYPALPLGGARNDFLAKSAEGSPVFLLHDSSPMAYRPTVSLKTISIQYQVTCRVVVDTRKLEGQFAILTCDSSSPELFELFVRCIVATSERLPTEAGTKQLEQRISELLELFSTLTRPATKQLSGLWAELFIIQRTTNIASAVRAWRSSTFERFDFSSQLGCLEVKSAAGEVRRHDFSLEQLRAPDHGLGLVASLLLQPKNGGAGVMDLARKIEASIQNNAALRAKLWMNVTSSLGGDFSDRLDCKFDTSFAERNITFYSVSDIPAPLMDPDPRITNIRFQSDLTLAESTLKNSRNAIESLLEE